MAYPTRNREQVVDRALFVLGVTPVGQTPEDDDRQVVDDLVEPLFARLNAEGVTSLTDEFGVTTELDDPDAIPAAWYLDVAVLLAAEAMAPLGVDALPPGYDPEMSRMRLRTVLSIGPTMEDYTVIDEETNEELTKYRPETLIGEYF
jgi:hypothetical protein